MHHDKNNLEGIRKLLEVNELSESWRKTFQKRISGNEVETSEQLMGNK